MEHHLRRRHDGRRGNRPVNPPCRHHRTERRKLPEEGPNQPQKGEIEKRTLSSEATQRPAILVDADRTK